MSKSNSESFCIEGRIKKLAHNMLKNATYHKLISSKITYQIARDNGNEIALHQTESSRDKFA